MATGLKHADDYLVDKVYFMVILKALAEALVDIIDGVVGISEQAQPSCPLYTYSANILSI